MRRIANTFLVTYLLGLLCGVYLAVGTVLGIIQWVHRRGTFPPTSEVLALLSCVMLAVLDGVGLYASWQTRNRHSRQWAFIASVLLIVPCASPCFLLTAPFGLYALSYVRRMPDDAWSATR